MPTDVATQSRSDEAKGPILEAIKRCDGCVEASSYPELRTMLGLEGEVSLRVLRSALWKLTQRDKKLVFYTKRDHFDGPRADSSILAYGYRLLQAS